MSKTIKLKNSSRTPLHKMSEKEIQKLVIKEADRMLNAVPKELRVSEVNSVQMASSIKEVAESGAWAQWTRACCDRRSRIEDFENPIIRELTVGPVQEKAIFQNHFDSNMVIKNVTEVKSLKKIRAKRKK